MTKPACIDGTQAHRWVLPAPNGERWVEATCARGCKQTRKMPVSHYSDWPENSRIRQQTAMQTPLDNFDPNERITTKVMPNRRHMNLT